MTFEEYLRRNSWPVKSSEYHTLKVTITDNPDSLVHFYIHNANESSETEDFLVRGNELIPCSPNGIPK